MVETIFKKAYVPKFGFHVKLQIVGSGYGRNCDHIYISWCSLLLKLQFNLTSHCKHSHLI